MIDIIISEKKFWQNDVEGYLIFLKENLETCSGYSKIEEIEKNYYPNLKEILKKHKFSGKKGESFVLTANKDKKLVHFIFLGLGSLKDRWNIELENMRRAVGIAVKLIKKLEIKTAVLNLPDEKPFGLIKARFIRQIVVTGFMADYEFEKFKTEKNGAEWSGKIYISVEGEIDQTFAISLREGSIIGKSVNMARHWSDLPSNYLTPSVLSIEAKKIADDFGLECKVLDRRDAEKLHMGGFLAVDSGSDEPGKFVIMEYWAEKKDVPTIALVGKGITFDTGGISLKPSNSMEGMKFDMSGAAAVIATMNVVAQLKPQVNVIGITPIVENMPSGKAFKQDDILTFMNGKTAEIKSTDAEGRLILADALCYAEKFYNPEVIIDIATLTGACSYALGNFYSALLARDETVGTKLQAISLVTGDRVWPLPFDEDFKEAIKSDVADLANCGASSYKAGTITASWFLSNFVQKAKWAHIDIAGTAYAVPGVSYFGKGATGSGVRLLTEFVLNYTK